MYAVRDVVKMKKPHACGANAWLILRVGADIKLKCEGCGHMVMLSRHDFDKRLKRVLRHSEND